jgi:hypothetical protein
MSDLDGFPTRIAMKPTFGTLEWGKKNNGVLTRTAQFHFLRNMGREDSNPEMVNWKLRVPGARFDVSPLSESIREDARNRAK